MSREGSVRRGRLNARSLAVPIVLALGIGSAVAQSSNAEDPSPLELSLEKEGRRVFMARGSMDVATGTLVLMCLTFEGEIVPGTWRRVEIRESGAVTQVWETKDAFVIDGDYAVVATIDSSRQPRSLRAAFPGPPRRFEAHAYVGRGTDAVAAEEKLRERVLDEARLLAEIGRECASLAPLTSSSDAKARATRRAVVDRMELRLDTIEHGLETRLPPVVFAPQLPDAQYAVRTAARLLHEALPPAQGPDLERPGGGASFGAARGRRTPLLTIDEAVGEALRVEKEVRSRRPIGPRALRELAVEARALADELERGPRATSRDGMQSSSALRERMARTSEQLAKDPGTASLAGGTEVLSELSRTFREAVEAATDAERLRLVREIRQRVGDVSARLARERERRALEVGEVLDTLVLLDAELGDLRAHSEKALWEKWRARVAEARGRAKSLSPEAKSFFPGAPGDLDLAGRALLAREPRGDADSYLQGVFQDVVARLRSPAP